MNKYIIASLLASMAVPCMISAQHKTKVTIAPKKKNPKVQFGIASFYANKFNGRRTANGEIFSQQKLTAASNKLPLNTWVKVTNLKNKRNVVLRVTDRMHHLNKRLIDLSRAAAKQLGYTGRGLAKVRVEVLGRHKIPREELASDR
jgi:rare lipoprotein A